MAPYVAVGSGFKAEIAIRRGAPTGAVEILRHCLDKLHSMPYELLSTSLTIALVQGLAAVGRFAEGLRLIDETIQLVEATEEHCYMPELLRVKGGILLSMAEYTADDAEACFAQSLELSRRQGALAWELRTTTDMATLMASRGQSDEARGLLQSVVARFVEGFDRDDLTVAQNLLAQLNAPA
jgi:predicted ATPase